MTKNKIPPQALEIEKAILGAIMLDKEAVSVATELLRQEMFYNPNHQTVFASIQRVAGKSSNVDLLTVSEDLKKAGELDRVGGIHFLAGLTNAVVSSAHLVTHCRILVQCYLLRELIQLGGELYTKGFETSADPFVLLEDAERRMQGITQSLAVKDFLKIDEALIKVIQEIESKRNRETYFTGVPTRYHDLDVATCGWQPSDLIVLAARPKCGKTAFALNLALNAVDSENGVGFFSMEMSAEQLVKRILSNKASIYLQSLRDARLDDGQMQHLHRHGIQKLAGSDLYIDDTAALTVAEFKSKARRMVNRYRVKMLFVDYIQLMQPERGKKQSSREQEVATITRQLKIAAKELNVPIFALSQLNREADGKVPQLSNLRESGAIEQDADMVMFLYRGATEEEIKEDKSKEKQIFLKIAAYRNGEPRTIEFEFKGEYQRFCEVGNANDPENNKPGSAWGDVPF